MGIISRLQIEVRELLNSPHNTIKALQALEIEGELHESWILRLAKKSRSHEGIQNGEIDKATTGLLNSPYQYLQKLAILRLEKVRQEAVQNSYTNAELEKIKKEFACQSAELEKWRMEKAKFNQALNNKDSIISALDESLKDAQKEVDFQKAEYQKALSSWTDKAQEMSTEIAKLKKELRDTEKRNLELEKRYQETLNSCQKEINKVIREKESSTDVEFEQEETSPIVEKAKAYAKEETPETLCKVCSEHTRNRSPQICDQCQSENWSQCGKCGLVSKKVNLWGRCESCQEKTETPRAPKCEEIAEISIENRDWYQENIVTSPTKQEEIEPDTEEDTDSELRRLQKEQAQMKAANREARRRKEEPPYTRNELQNIRRAIEKLKNE